MARYRSRYAWIRSAQRASADKIERRDQDIYLPRKAAHQLRPGKDEAPVEKALRSGDFHYRYLQALQEKGIDSQATEKTSLVQTTQRAGNAQKTWGVVQVDTKYVWQDSTRKYQRTFVDIFTGFHHAVICDTLTAAATVHAFEEAEHVFLFPILGIQNDNGSENRGEFHQYLGTRGIAHYFIPKSSPNWDGAVERAHGVIDQEFYLNPTRPWRTLPEYLHWYNYERIHLGKYLNGLTPFEKFTQYQQKVSPLKVN